MICISIGSEKYFQAQKSVVHQISLNMRKPCQSNFMGWRLHVTNIVKIKLKTFDNVECYF